MNSGMCCVLISLTFYLLFCAPDGFAERRSRYPEARSFLGYKPTSSVQKHCDCKTSMSCSCCQNVIILYTKAEKNLCVNFSYMKDNLNINATLDSNTLKSKNVTDYKPTSFCFNVPGCFFSTACVNVLELNKFPRSITACLRLDILAKKRTWQLNYDCISVSTDMSMKPMNGTMSPMNDTDNMGGMSTTMKTEMTTMMTTEKMKTTKKMMTTTMMTTAETEETTTSGEVELIIGNGGDATVILDIE